MSTKPLNSGKTVHSEKLDTKRRVKALNHIDDYQEGRSVIYVMSRDQRIEDNYALLAAQDHALSKNLPLAVVFGLRSPSGFRSREHYRWMMSGLMNVETSLNAKNIPFLLVIGDAYERISGCIRHLRPDAIYFDFSPLKGPQKLQSKLVDENKVPMYVVDTHNIIPTWVVSDKQEYAARTIRPKIHNNLAEYLVQPPRLKPHPYNWTGPVISMDDLKPKIDNLLSTINSNLQVNLLDLYPPGEVNANKRLQSFLKNKFENYFHLRNDPSKEGLTDLSPYLHFGQISSQRVILEALKYCSADSKMQPSYDVLVEEMVVRKELSDNYCFYNSNYDNISGAADWAIKTLKNHKSDEREFLYSLEDLEQAKTHDPAWNAAQTEALKTGKIHGYMRMYWAKKVLEWSSSPDEAIKTLIYLNDFYSLDGGDPNGYVGILWSVAGLHDRPWGERQVYGTIRSMVYDGLKRKFNVQKYIDNWVF